MENKSVETRIIKIRDFNYSELVYNKNNMIISEDTSILEYIIFNKTTNRLYPFSALKKLDKYEQDILGLKILNQNMSSDIKKFKKFDFKKFQFIENKLEKTLNYMDLEVMHNTILIMVYSKFIKNENIMDGKNIWHISFKDKEVLDFLIEKFNIEKSLDKNTIMLSDTLESIII